MSGLAALLAGRTPPGVCRWSSHARVVDVRHAVEHAGWRFIHLDTWAVGDKHGFLDAAADAFGFPDGFGGNWDAFADALSDVRADRGTLVLWDGWSPLAREQPQVFEVAVDVLRQRCEAEYGGRFAVLLRGEGPPIDVPQLDPHHAPSA